MVLARHIRAIKAVIRKITRKGMDILHRPVVCQVEVGRIQGLVPLTLCHALAEDSFQDVLLVGKVAALGPWVGRVVSHRGSKGLATQPPPLSGNSLADPAILDTILQGQKTADFLVLRHP